MNIFFLKMLIAAVKIHPQYYKNFFDDLVIG